MPLVACPDCERQISDAASVCIHCGRPMSVIAASPEVGSRAPRNTTATARHVASAKYTAARSTDPGTTPSVSLACTKCHSPDVRRLSLIYREGLSSIASDTSGVGIGGGRVGVGHARTSGVQQTVLSRQATPPQPRSTGGVAVGAVLGLLGGIGSLSGGDGGVSSALFLIGIVCGFILWSAIKYNRDQYPRFRAQWEKSFMCARCGEVFVSELQ